MKTPYGERVTSAKLTEDQVREIRERYELFQRNRPKVLAEEYGMSDCQIRAIAKKESWRHVQ